MPQRLAVEYTRRMLSISSIALLGISLSGCVTGAERQQINLQRDASTCESFGASYGSSDYSNCMLEQQRRRDARQMDSLERTRLATEIARDAQVMADRARWSRCNQDPGRRECGR